MRIGIYGGSFDPPHIGHAEAARAAAAALKLDKLILVPAALPPHKELSAEGAGAEDRLAMTGIMADVLGRNVEVDRLELDRAGKSYTADTLREMKARYPGDELWLLMGSDMLFSFQNWREPEVILSLAAVAAFAREEEDDLREMKAHAGKLSETYGARVEVIPLPVHPCSSTQVRRELKEGKRPQGLLDPVYGYILRHGLYGTNADLKHLSDEKLRACSLSMVYAKRHAHILGVEETAVKLAQRWGADPQAARRAGILHDCTKYLSLKEHLDICKRAGIVPDEMEAGSAKLLHSKTGAALAQMVYGESDEVYWAIYWHTTGRADMGLLEKIVYLADYMEPNRDFEGVEELRRLCDTDLDAALQMGLEMSVADLEARGVPIHKNTQGALDWVREHRKGT